MREYLPEGDFSIMTEMLKDASYMNLTVSKLCILWFYIRHTMLVVEMGLPGRPGVKTAPSV